MGLLICAAILWGSAYSSLCLVWFFNNGNYFEEWDFSKNGPHPDADPVQVWVLTLLILSRFA